MRGQNQGRKVMRNCLKLLAIIAFTALIPVTANAKVIKPGQYSVSGSNGAYQEICFRADGTWYGVTYSPWGGEWSLSGRATFRSQTPVTEMTRLWPGERPHPRGRSG
jgi:hypothetical protein